MRVDLLVVNAVYSQFFALRFQCYSRQLKWNEVVIELKRIRKLRFQCDSRQLKWNQVVIQLKRSGRLLLTSLKLSFKYLLLRYPK